MYTHKKAEQSKNRVHISWDILYVADLKHVLKVRRKYHIWNIVAAKEAMLLWLTRI